MKNLQVVKSLKLSFDLLGYAVINGEITKNRNVYRKLLRSGKVAEQRLTSSDRTFQTNRFYNTYFKTDINPVTRCDYKSVIGFILNASVNDNQFLKPTQKIATNLLKRGYLELFNLPDGNKLLRDSFNNKEFYYSITTRRIYRLVNSKALPYKVKY